MKTKTLSYYAGLANECLKNDQEKMDMYAEIDKHRKGKWKPSGAMSALPWIGSRNFSSTAPADALDAGSRTFATLMPKITLAPLTDEIAEYEDAERKETALEWHFKRMNMIGKKTTHWRIMESAMRYCAVAFETEYLPFALKGREKDNRVKAILRGSAFNWPVHHPGTVHPRHSKYGLESVCLVKIVNFQEMLDEYGEDYAGIAEIITNEFKGKVPKPEEAMKRFFNFCKVTDWDETCTWLSVNNGGMVVQPNMKARGSYKLMHKAHGLKFIPWVIVDNEDPILKNAINTGLLDNLNNLRLISWSAAVSLAAWSQQLIQTQDGTLKGVKIDNKNPNQPMVTDLATKVTTLPPPRPNEGLETKVAQATGEVYTSTVAQILADANKLAGTENFSTANMAFQMALGALSLAKDAAERAEAEGFFQMFKWIDHAGDKPLTAYREKGKTFMENDLAAGEEIVIRKGEFDTERLYIEVKMREFSRLDEQAKWNLATTQVERLNFSRKMVAEELGVENYSLHETNRGVEDILLARIAAEAAKIKADADAYATKVVGAAQAEAAAAVQAAQQPAQQPAPAPDSQVTDMNADFPVAEGADMRGGMMPAAPSNPGETRETLTGTDASGVQLA